MGRRIVYELLSRRLVWLPPHPLSSPLPGRSSAPSLNRAWSAGWGSVTSFPLRLRLHFPLLPRASFRWPSYPLPPSPWASFPSASYLWASFPCASCPWTSSMWASRLWAPCDLGSTAALQLKAASTSCKGDSFAVDSRHRLCT